MNGQQHFAAVIHAMEERLKAKTLEAAAYQQLQEVMPKLMNQLARFPSHEVEEAIGNLLTAKLNSAVLDMKDLELNLDALRRQSSPIALPGLQKVPTRPA